MSTIVNAAPQANLQGIQNLGSTASQAVAETLPQFLPHVFFFAQKGQLTPALLSGDTFSQLYGSKTLDPTQPYYYHPNALIANIFANGGSILAQRIVPDDAPAPAGVQIAIDLLATTVPVSGTGSASGTVNNVPGYVGKIVALSLPVSGLGTGGATTSGSMSTSGGVQSVVYPLFDIQTSSQGSDGNNQGFAISAPTTKSVVAANPVASAAVDAFIYNFRQVSRTSANVTGLTVPAFSGDQYVPFTLAPSSYDADLNTDFAMVNQIIQAYGTPDNPGFVPQPGNFGALHAYQANIDNVLTMIFAAEYAAGGTGVHITGTPTIQQMVQSVQLPNGAMPGDKYQVNLFGATDIEGNPYLTFSLLGSSQGGIILTDNYVQYAVGGGDGTMNFTTLDNLVQQQLLGYGSSVYNFTDMAMWPQSWFIDSGYSITTKEAAGTLLGVRKDIGVIVATQDVSQPQNTAAEDSSLAVALSASLSQYVESQVYGTPVCRAAVVGQSGYLISSVYKGLLPLTIDVAGKMAAYMGAGNGYWTSGKDFSVTPLNKCTIFRGVNATSKTAQAYAADWTNNLVWAQNYDRSSIFYPAFQTVFDDDTSTLNSLKTVAACIELEKVCFRSWRDLTGRDDLTPAQLIKQSNLSITNQCPSAKFDGKFTVTPKTYFSSADAARNYSWTCDVTLGANPMYTVGTFTISAANMSALSAKSSG